MAHGVSSKPESLAVPMLLSATPVVVWDQSGIILDPWQALHTGIIGFQLYSEIIGFQLYSVIWDKPPFVLSLDRIPFRLAFVLVKFRLGERPA